MKKNPSVELKQNGLLTAPEVAKILGMHVKTLRRKIREKEISLKPVITETEKGRRIKFRAKDVETYIDHNQAAGDRVELKKRTRYYPPSEGLISIYGSPMSDEEAQEFFEGATSKKDD